MTRAPENKVFIRIQFYGDLIISSHLCHLLTIDGQSGFTQSLFYLKDQGLILGKRIGRFVKLWGQMGVTTKDFTSGCRIGPPAAKL